MNIMIFTYIEFIFNYVFFKYIECHEQCTFTKNIESFSLCFAFEARLNSAQELLLVLRSGITLLAELKASYGC